MACRRCRTSRRFGRTHKATECHYIALRAGGCSSTDLPTPEFGRGTNIVLRSRDAPFAHRKVLVNSYAFALALISLIGCGPSATRGRKPTTPLVECPDDYCGFNGPRATGATISAAPIDALVLPSGQRVEAR